MLLLGTRKGLWTLTPNDARDTWSLSGPELLGHIVNHAVADPRDPAVVLLGVSTGHLGPTVMRSTDGGRTFTEASKPPAFRTGDKHDRALRSVFWLTPGHADERGTWYAGGSPQGLFRSEDAGDTWTTVDGWNDHERWADWAEWPAENTPDGSMLHSVIVDPRDANHLYLGLSAGGVFESTDGGTDWHPLNAGIEAEFLPTPDAEFGHDPHTVRLHPAMPDRLYQQNHCGIYRLDRPATRWERIGDNMPREIGATWTRLDKGLPERGWLTVKRQAMTVDAGDPVGVYFGTTGGEVWGSADEGATWANLAAHLPELYSVEWVPS